MRDLIVNNTYLNKQKYQECLLVTRINAAVYLYGNIKITNDEYERLVDLVGARYGTAISPEKAEHYFNLDSFQIFPKVNEIKKCIKKGMPIEAHVYAPEYGYHSVLIVDIKKDKVKVTNFRKYTTKNMWIKWEDFIKYIRLTPHCNYFLVFRKYKEDE